LRRIFEEYRDWAFLFTYLAVILIILPFSEYPLRSFAKIIPFPSRVVSLLIYGIMIITVMALVIYVIFAKKKFKLLRLSVLASILFMGLHSLGGITDPYDKLHIVEYSILSFCLFRVLRFYNPTTALYLWCVVFVAIAGFTDEFIQGFFPGRQSGLQDIKVDICAGILSQLTIALVIFPRLERWRIKIAFLKKGLYKRERWSEKYNKNRCF